MTTVTTYTADQLSTMGKEALRQACRDASISYGKLNNDGMRAALLQADDDQDVEATEPPKPSILSSLFGVTKPVQQHTDQAHVTRVVDGKKVDPAKPVVEKKDPPAVRNYAKNYKIDPNRPRQNDVTRPSAGTVCGAVWAYLDANPDTQAKQVTAIAEEHGWNRTNVLCELYNFRKFMGMTKATKEQK